MTYQEEFLSKITDDKKWPQFNNPNFLRELQLFADGLFVKDNKDNTEGYLAALLIYHQLCEEIVKKLIECSNFFYTMCDIPKGNKNSYF